MASSPALQSIATRDPFASTSTLAASIMSGAEARAEAASNYGRAFAGKAEQSDDSQEIGDLAVWSVSSAKPGNGVELLRDGKTDTFWQ